MTHPLNLSDPQENDVPPAARLGAVLFLLADGMFFVGLIAAVLVVRGGHGGDFHRWAAVLDRKLGLIGLAASVAAGAALATAVRSARAGLTSKSRRLAGFSALFGVAFLASAGIQFRQLLTHETVVARDVGAVAAPGPARLAIFDGKVVAQTPQALTIFGTRAAVPAEAANAVDLHDLTPADVRRWAAPAGIDPAPASRFTLPAAAVIDRASYGPSRNVFLGCFFALVGSHVAQTLILTARTAVLVVGPRGGENGRLSSLTIATWCWLFLTGLWLAFYALFYRA